MGTTIPIEKQLPVFFYSKQIEIIMLNSFGASFLNIVCVDEAYHLRFTAHFLGQSLLKIS
jgi:hypothetical protein